MREEINCHEALNVSYDLLHPTLWGVNRCLLRQVGLVELLAAAPVLPGVFLTHAGLVIKPDIGAADSKALPRDRRTPREDDGKDHNTPQDVWRSDDSRYPLTAVECLLVT